MGSEKSARAAPGHSSDSRRNVDKAAGPTHGMNLQSFGERGKPLAGGVRSAMESRLGRDLSHVRIHADDRAGLLADSLGARAFTLRNHIFFGTGGFSPHDPNGRSLLVHELTHVLQQQPEAVDVDLPPSLENWRISRPGDAAEREAEAAARHHQGNEPIIIQERARDVLQADWAGAGIGALIGGTIGALAGALIGGPLGAAIGGGVGLVAGALIGGLAGGQFPSYAEIVADAGVQSRMTAAWASTEAAANATTRREEGFWVKQNLVTNSLECTATVPGPPVGPGQTGRTVFPEMPADTNPHTASAIYTIALFHTHTPTTYRPVGRPIGPSSQDDQVHNRLERVGIIYDYVESPARSGQVPAGHPIGSPARLYHSGPNRRPRA